MSQSRDPGGPSPQPSRRGRARRGSLLVGVALAAVLAVGLRAQTGAGRDQEETARLRFQSGLAFLAQQRYGEAVKDFTAVTSSFPTSSVADDAWLELARYHLEVAGELDQAQAAVDALANKYPASDSAAMGLVLGGRVLLARGRAPAESEAALASFDRVPRLHPGSPAIPAAAFYAGETLRLAKRFPDAIERFRQLTLDYPTSPWSARALLDAGRCLTIVGQPQQALQQLQRVRSRFPDSEQQITALLWNTILFRLYVRAPAHPAFYFGDRGFTGSTGKLRDVDAIAATGEQVIVATRSSLLFFDFTGVVKRSSAMKEPRGMFLDAAGQPVVTFKSAFQVGAAPVRPVMAPKPDGSGRELDGISSGVGTSMGDLLLVDRDGKAILRFSAEGKHLGTFAPFNTERLAINGLDDVAALSRDDKSITIFDRTGAVVVKIPAKAAAYELRNPVSMAFDALGHLYVLDRGNRPSVYVFSPQAKFVTSFAIDPNAPGAFREPVALAVDPAGRLYIYDERAERVQLYH
jgi:outer membrane protein assembly factor BamD (BamD/ComL family)